MERDFDTLVQIVLGKVEEAIARGASPAVLAALRHDPTPRVVAALLENPRLTEATLLPLLASEQSSPQALAVVAGNPKWSSR